MAGRKPKPVEQIKGNRSKKELADRKKLQPTYSSQTFAVPKELTEKEAHKWREVTDIIKKTANSPNSDADKDKLIRYCKSWVRYINLDKLLQEKQNDKDIIKLLNSEDKNLNKLSSDLMLDPISRIKAGNALFSNGCRPNEDEDDFY